MPNYIIHAISTFRYWRTSLPILQNSQVHYFLISKNPLPYSSTRHSIHTRPFKTKNLSNLSKKYFLNPLLSSPQKLSNRYQYKYFHTASQTHVHLSIGVSEELAHLLSENGDAPLAGRFCKRREQYAQVSAEWKRRINGRRCT